MAEKPTPPPASSKPALPWLDPTTTHIEQLHDPVTELLNWRDAMHAGGHLTARPSVRGGDDIGPEAEDLYREEQRDRDV